MTTKPNPPSSSLETAKKLILYSGQFTLLEEGGVLAILSAYSAEVERRATDKALRWAKQMIDLHGVELGRAEILKRMAENEAEGKGD